MNTLSGEQFFLQKEGEVLIFATHINMHLLAEATTIYVDGMFEICLRLFYQVFTINANSSHALVYGLLPGKSRDVYHQFFMGVKEEAMNNGQHISQKKSRVTLSSPLYSHLSLSFQVLIFKPATFILHNVYGEKCRDLAWWRSTNRMNLLGASYRKVQPLLLSHPILYVCHGMDLKLRCQIIVRCRATQIISTKPG